jgi:hypothetical protein
MQFNPFEPNIEVNGNTVRTIAEGFGLVKHLAEEHFSAAGLPNINDIKNEEWYSQEKWLKAFESVARSYEDDGLFKIGMKIPENATFPPNIKTIEDAMQSIDIAYHLNHRKRGFIMFDQLTGKMEEGIGHYGYKKVEGENMIIMECINPYPCSFDKGIITCMAKKFMPNAKVFHNDFKSCRKTGADGCTYIITW